MEVHDLFAAFDHQEEIIMEGTKDSKGSMPLRTTHHLFPVVVEFLLFMFL